MRRIRRNEPRTVWRYSSELHCARLRPLATATRRRALFSFNSPARRLRDLPRLRPHHRHRLRPRHSGREQDAARGRDQALADASPTPSARRTWRSSPSSAAFRSIRRGASSAPRQRKWVIEGEGAWTQARSGTACKRFFAWLETRAYKMHIRVLLSRYRAYTPCAACAGARLKTEALLWRIGSRGARRARRSAVGRPFRPRGRGSGARQTAARRCPASRSMT